MSKHLSVALAGIALASAVIVLWLRVRELERSVDALNEQVQSKPRLLSMEAGRTESKKNVEKRPIFKLIDSANTDEGASDVGVPWSVEHGMMIDAAEHATPPSKVETESTMMIESSPSIIEELQQPQIEQPPTSPSSENEFN